MNAKIPKLAACCQCGTQTQMFIETFASKLFLFCPNDGCKQKGIGLDTTEVSEDGIVAVVRRWNERMAPGLEKPLA